MKVLIILAFSFASLVSYANENVFDTSGSVPAVYMTVDQAESLSESIAWKKAFKHCGKTLPVRLSNPVRSTVGDNVTITIQFQCGV